MAPELTPGEALDRGGTACPHIPGTPAPPVVSGMSSSADSSAEPTRRRRGPGGRAGRGVAGGGLTLDPSHVESANVADIDAHAGSSRIPILFCGPL
ncbi:UDP-N-acetylglucosamine 1-carboxyvinyltransferase, partial [Streptomyces mirabilis]